MDLEEYGITMQARRRATPGATLCHLVDLSEAAFGAGAEIAEVRGLGRRLHKGAERGVWGVWGVWGATMLR